MNKGREGEGQGGEEERGEREEREAKGALSLSPRYPVAPIKTGTRTSPSSFLPPLLPDRNTIVPKA